MAKVDTLLHNYRRQVALRWTPGLAGKQKIWFAVYDNTDERRIRLRIDDFAAATKQAGHGWVQYDLTNAFPTWMAAHDYRDAYFEDPEDLYESDALDDFVEPLAREINAMLNAADDNTVATLIGPGCLFGVNKLSLLLSKIESHIKGRLLVFFPGSYDEDHGYRLLEAHRDWNYLAVPITANKGTSQWP
jgi:hypothetical protein